MTAQVLLVFIICLAAAIIAAAAACCAYAKAQKVHKWKLVISTRQA